MNSADYIRFVHDLYEFNDTTPAAQFSRRSTNESSDVGLTMSNIEPRERIVDIHGWCLMRNHYHLLLSERLKGGLSLFLRKLNVGYARAFNEKHKRKGTLFQSRTKKILIEDDAHFLYILHYIHLNPLDYLQSAKEWRVRSHQGIRNTAQAISYLNEYRWSSYLDYCGEKNFPSILTTSLFKDALGDYPTALKDYLREAAQDMDASPTLE